MKDTPGINDYMYYVGGAFRTFQFYIEDEPLSSFSFLVSGSRKVWYTVLIEIMTSFKFLVATKILSSDFLTDHYGKGWQIIATKIYFNSELLLKSKVNTKVTQVVRKCNRFVILGLSFYHGGFNMAYNIAKATNFADFS